MTALGLLLVLIAVTSPASSQGIDSGGRMRDPFASTATARVLLFVRTDCPLTNRYAPELRRIASEFVSRGVEFWLVYADSAETGARIQSHVAEYQLPGIPVRDPHHVLTKRAEATVAPQAAVFDGAGRLAYSGRIDDRYVDFGKARPTARTHDLQSAISAVLSGKAVTPPRTRAIGCFLADVN